MLKKYQEDTFKVKTMIFIKGGDYNMRSSHFTLGETDGRTKIHTKMKMMIYVWVNFELQPEAKKGSRRFLLSLIPALLHPANLKAVQADTFWNVDSTNDLNVWL